jgi:F0F1-type ATP synthase membrane subunit c/vacuolar-type H+-ATPase subunit K
MKKRLRIFVTVLIMVLAISFAGQAQCSICTKTAQQMGERPAKALNGGILYLAAMPFLIFSYIGYRWYKSNHEG